MTLQVATNDEKGVVIGAARSAIMAGLAERAVVHWPTEAVKEFAPGQSIEQPIVSSSTHRRMTPSALPRQPQTFLWRLPQTVAGSGVSLGSRIPTKPLKFFS